MSFRTAHPALAASLETRGYTEATPVQAAILAALEAPETRDRDLLVSAQTGSGKTVAFGLALASQLLGDARKLERAGAPLALVIAPTRELAQQVHTELSWLYAGTDARIATCVGGFDPRREQQTLARGAHIVVGTPGRLCDHLDRGALVLSRVKGVVLDEADEMLDMGFRDELEHLLDAAPSERRTLMFSATVDKDIAALAKRYQRDAHRIATQAATDRHRDIEYHAVPIVPRERDLAVVNVLRYHEVAGALVFCATREGVNRLAANLTERGFSVVALSGDLSQRERTAALQALRDRRARVCVATDVAARGLDLPDLGLVIHADLPHDKEGLVHRSGRTGRAGRQGVAVLLVPDPARRHAERLLSTAHVQAQWMRAPTPEQILQRDQLQLVGEISALATDVTEEDLQVARTLLPTHGAEQLAAMLVSSQRRARPAAEVVSEPPSMRPRPPVEPRPQRGPGHDRPPGPPRGKQQRAPFQAAGASNREGGGAWFTINVGRSKNADPKWLIPLLCRRGDIDKRDIGKIQVLARETRVEIAPTVSERFAEAVRRPDTKDRSIHIEPLEAE